MSRVLSAFENLDSVIDERGEYIYPKQPEALGIIAVRGAVELRLSRLESTAGMYNKAVTRYIMEQAWLNNGSPYRLKTGAVRNNTGGNIFVFRGEPIPTGLSIQSNFGEAFTNHSILDGINVGEGFNTRMDQEVSYRDSMLLSGWAVYDGIESKSRLGLIVHEALDESGFLVPSVDVK